MYCYHRNPVVTCHHTGKVRCVQCTDSFVCFREIKVFTGKQIFFKYGVLINPLNAELNPICYLLALLAHYFLHVSMIRVKSLTLKTKTKLRGLSPRANYTDRAAAAGRRS